MTLYDGEIHFTDAQIGRGFDYLKASGQFESTIIIVTADHGEAFGTHELFGHGELLYDELLHVPLIVRAPGANGPRTVDTPQETKDIFHTVLSLLGVEAPAASRYNLLSDQRDYVFSEVTSNKREKRVAILNEKWKLVYTLDEGVELFDRVEDAEETVNVAEENPQIVGDWLARLTDEMNIVILDDEALERLARLVTSTKSNSCAVVWELFDPDVSEENNFKSTRTWRPVVHSHRVSAPVRAEL